MPSTAVLPRTSQPWEPVDDRTWRVASATGRLEFRFPTGPVFVLDRNGTGRYVLPGHATGRTLSGRDVAWILPTAVDAQEPAWLVRHRPRPHADVHGDEFAFDVPGGAEFADAAAGFSWGTMLPCVVERTIAADYPDTEGFVMSTLADTHLGTYPDVHHEFQVTGRLAWGSATDLDVVRRNVCDLLGAASCVVDQIDGLGRLWSDVHHEDQVIEDGRETTAASLAANSFDLLASLLVRLAEPTRAREFADLRDRLVAAVRAPLPQGYWDPRHHRFVDWVDRNGGVHDHLHLLAGMLPAPFGQADSEMGTAGPCDLCAAGRYWCWDAAYWHWRARGDVRRDQLLAVAREGSSTGYVMGERYDMDHVHHVDGSTWHGVAHHYEYPCVSSWVLFTEHLGVRASFEADLLISPRIVGTGTVTLRQRVYRLARTLDEEGFALINLAENPRRFALDLAALLPGTPTRTVELAAGQTLRVGR